MNLQLAGTVVRELLRALRDPKQHIHSSTLWQNRCILCGHRQPVDGAPVIETRKLPWRMWFPEIIGRSRAIQYGKVGA